MAKREEIPKTNPAEVVNLTEQIRGTNLEPSAKERIERLLRTILILVELLQRKNTSIKKLRETIFGKRTERHQMNKAERQEETECAIVLDAVGKVYGYEAETKGMGPDERLAYHQAKSGAVMKELKEWIEMQFAERLVEPNSSLGRALQYWLNHWEKLTAGHSRCNTFCSYSTGLRSVRHRNTPTQERKYACQTSNNLNPLSTSASAALSASPRSSMTSSTAS